MTGDGAGKYRSGRFCSFHGSLVTRKASGTWPPDCELTCFLGDSCCCLGTSVRGCGQACPLRWLPPSPAQYKGAGSHEERAQCTCVVDPQSKDPDGARGADGDGPPSLNLPGGSFSCTITCPSPASPLPKRNRPRQAGRSEGHKWESPQGPPVPGCWRRRHRPPLPAALCARVGPVLKEAACELGPQPRLWWRRHKDASCVQGQSWTSIWIRASLQTLLCLVLNLSLVLNLKLDTLYHLVSVPWTLQSLLSPHFPTHPPLSGASQHCQAISRDRAPVLVAALLREAWWFCQLPRAGPTGLSELQGHLTLSVPGNAQTTDPVPAQGSCGRTNGSAEGTLKREGFSPCSTAGVSVYLVPPTCHSGGMGAPQDPSLHGEVAASRRMPGPLLPGDSGGALGGVAGLWPRCGPPVVGFHRGCGSPTRGGSGDGAAARGLRPRMCCLGFPH